MGFVYLFPVAADPRLVHNFTLLFMKTNCLASDVENPRLGCKNSFTVGNRLRFEMDLDRNGLPHGFVVYVSID